MPSPLESLVATGTKLWLDSIDPELLQVNRGLGATGATSNPAIISGLINSGRFDDRIAKCIETGQTDPQIAWSLTDQLVSEAQALFHPVWRETRGEDGYVSFELDPLLEDATLGPPHEQRVRQYVQSGLHWADGRDNRMIKVPATPAGLESLEALAAAGVTLNVTLIFTQTQYEAARAAVWRGAQKRGDLENFKSVYSVFVSRIDAYTRQHVRSLSADAQGEVGILNAKRIWHSNQEFWQQHPTRLAQEIIFASTGTKDPSDLPWKYVLAFAGSDIETNPPATNDAVQASGLELTRQVDQLVAPSIQQEIDREVDFAQMEVILMSEGLVKFSDPQQALLALIAEKRVLLGPN